VFVLLETFIVMDVDFNYCSNFFSDYNLQWVSALKSSKKGRASGRMLLGIRASIPRKLVSHLSIFGRNIIYFEFRGLIIYVVPIYLNCNKQLQ